VSAVSLTLLRVVIDFANLCYSAVSLTKKGTADLEDLNSVALVAANKFLKKE
jgi:hypothetical protein